MPKFAMTVKERLYTEDVFPSVLILVPCTNLPLTYRHNIMLMRNGIELFHSFEIKLVFFPSHTPKETWTFMGGNWGGGEGRWLS